MAEHYTLKASVILDASIEKKVKIIKGVIDIRNRNMTASDKTDFKKAASGVAIIIILESVPPHFHLQF